jgi:hypothetical protein
MSSRRSKAAVEKPEATPAPVAPALVVGALAWLVPGAGHVWVGRWGKGLVFFVTLSLMFVIGLGLRGRLFPFEWEDPLVALAAVANWGMGLVYFTARGMRFGTGQVVALTYEYGNAFLIVAGLLNALVVLDACDIARGRK